MDFFSWLSDKMSSLSDSIINALPKSPIYYLSTNATVKEVLGYLNFFVPVYTIIGMLENWLIAIVVYYVLQIILRWVKVIE